MNERANSWATQRRAFVSPLRVLGSAFVLICAPLTARAQEGSNSRLAETSSPRATLYSFIDACNELHELIESERHFDRTSPEHRPIVRRILDCLDTSELPEHSRFEVASEAATCIKEILDRITIPPDDEIPDLTAIEAAGGPEKLVRWHMPGSRLSIGRVEEGDQKDEYLFRPGTVARAPEYFEEIQSLPYRTTGPKVSPGLYQWFYSAPGNPLVAKLVDQLPESFRQQTLGMARWKWIGLMGAALIALALLAAIYFLQNRLVRRWQGKSLLLYCLTVLLPITAVIVPLAFKHFAEHALTIRGTAIYVVSFAANFMATLALLVVVMAISNRIAEIIISPSHISPKGLNAQFARISCRMLGILACVIVLLEGGQYLGLPLTTLLASAGVGGLAVALAAQHALKNVIGTMMLMADKPFHVGDRIVVGNYDGVVENIGLRSTRVRLLNSHVVTMPNDKLAEDDVENIGGRQHIRRVANIHLPLDTPLEKIEQCVAQIKDMLTDHEGMDPEFPPRVYFDEFNPDSFNLRIWYWYSPPKYWDYLAFSQQLNLEICRIFKQQGIRFYSLSRVAHTSVEDRKDL
jgi:MscS family membrane protein